MRLFPKQLDISDEEGFSPDKDIFGRKTMGENLTSLIQKVDEPLVVAVDGQWGSGKTVFLKMWAGELRKLKYPVIYFDAFANDFSEDAFLPIAAEIVELASTLKKANKSKFEKIKSSTVDVGKVLLRSTARLGIKVATLSTLDVKDLEDALAKEASETFDKHIGELITRQDKVKSTFEGFKESLESLPSLLSGEDNELKPLIFIIDELDRCRPDFALQLIERIKHFFSVPNVHFVLGCNLEQFKNSVISVYGNGIDAHTYLQKFIHLVVHLVDEIERSRNTPPEKFLSHLETRFDIDVAEQGFFAGVSSEILVIATRINLSLRAIEHVVGHVVRALASIPPRQFKNAELIAGLAVLKVIKPELFLKAKLGTLEYKEVEITFGLLDSQNAEFNQAGSPFEEKLRDQRSLEQWWRYVTDRNCPNEILRSFGNTMAVFHFAERFDLLKYCANKQIDRFVDAKYS